MRISVKKYSRLEASSIRSNQTLAGSRSIPNPDRYFEHSMNMLWHRYYRHPRQMLILSIYLYQYSHLVSHFQRISVNTSIFWCKNNHQTYREVGKRLFTICHKLTWRSNRGGLSLTSVISTVNEQTPSKEGSPWSVAFTVTDTNLPSSPSRSNT